MAKRGKYYKVSKFSFTGLDAQHYRTTEQYTRAVETLFERAAADVAHNTANINPGEKEFTFDDYPSAKKHMEKVAGQLAGKVTATIERGSRKEWLFACAKNDEFLESIMETSKVKKSTLKKMQDRNLDALETFQGRKVGGMNLSQRVWKYVDEWKDHLEMALDVGLGDGVSAAKLARDVRQDLKDPNRLFRRVRDKHGNLVLSKHARAFHPGQGVYRSSVKNAQRLTRSEINMAYRESDFKRWQQLDFVVGFEIVRSNHEPHFECPLCDRLAGKYPKTFKFVGWHPQCMCKAIPILMDDETFDANELGELRAALRGTEYKALQGKNAVTEMPDGFMEWVQENAERQANWNSTPYFIRDNFMNGNLKDGLKIKMPAVEESGKIDYHVPFERLSKQEQRDWQRFIFNEYPIDYDFAHACKLYDIDIKSLENMMRSAYENNEYWREPELRAELSRVKDALNNAIATKKQEAERILAEFKNVVDESIGWIGEQRSTYEYAKDRFKEEQTEEYPNYVTFINSGNGGSLDVARVRKQIAEAKDAYNKALAAGRDCISKYGAQVDVTKLRNLLDEQRTEARNSLRITNEINKEIERIKNASNQDAEIENVLSMKKGEPMTFEDANQHRGNESYNLTIGEAWAEQSKYRRLKSDSHPYHVNCQSCVVAHEMRMRGYDVEAQPNYHRNDCVPTQLSSDTNLIWIDPVTGQQPQRIWMQNRFNRNSAKASAYAVKWFDEQTKEVGRYSLTYRWKVGGYKGGHIICAERLPDGQLRVYDPQVGNITSLEKICESLNWNAWRGETCCVQRVDTMLVDTKIIGDVVRKRNK